MEVEEGIRGINGDGKKIKLYVYIKKDTLLLSARRG